MINKGENHMEFGHNDGYYMKSRRTVKSTTGASTRNSRCKQARSNHEKERSSPVSPLQLSSTLEGINRFHKTWSSFTSLSPFSSASVASDDDVPNKVVATTRLIMPPNFSCNDSDEYGSTDIMKAHHAIKDASRKMTRVYDGLLSFDSKLTDISFRMLDSENAFASAHARCDTVTDLIKIALAHAAEFVRVYDAEHDVRRAIAAGPEGIDAQSYIHHVELLEDMMASKTGTSSLLSLHNLQDCIQTLISSCLLDRLWIMRLTRVTSALENMEASFHEESCHDPELLDASTHHLLRLWKTVLTDYGMITPLHVALPNSAEKWGKPPPPPPPLSPHLVLTLRDIIQKVASVGKEKAFLEPYKDIRSRKANECLQTLYPEYLQYSTSEAMDKLDWMNLKLYIQLWRQHLVAVTTILLTVEYDLCRQVFSSSLPASVWKRCFAMLAMQAGLEAFLLFGEAAATCSQEHPEKLQCLLDMVAVLEDVDIAMRELLANEMTSCSQEIGKLYDVQQLLVRAVSKAFRHFRYQFDLHSFNHNPVDGGVLEVSISTLTSICRLIIDPYEHILKQAVLMEQNEIGEDWKEFDLNHAILHMLNSLERRITDCGSHITSAKGQAFSCLFLMNNYWYIYVTLRDNEKMAVLLGDDCLKVYREKAKQSAHRYQREAWAPILQYLATEGMNEMVSKGAQDRKDGSKEGSEGHISKKNVLVNHDEVDTPKNKSFKIGSLRKNHKDSAWSDRKPNGTRKSTSFKECAGSNNYAVCFALEMQKVRAFQLAFEGVYQRHKGWMIQAVELRERIGQAVKRLVIPTYEIYVNSLMELARQNKAHVQLKYSLEMVEEMIDGLFQEEMSIEPLSETHLIRSSEIKKSRSEARLIAGEMDRHIDELMRRSHSTTACAALGEG